jgi:hypothetical protein
MIKFYCPSCRRALEANREVCGQGIQCPHCQSGIIAPQLPDCSPLFLGVSLLPSLHMLSPSLAMVLSSGKGKYWNWAQQLDADSLEGLLWVIGEFGSRYAAVSFPEPHFYRHSMDEVRMRNALRILAKIQSVGRVECDRGPFTRSDEDPFQLSEHASAFSVDYRELLAKGAHTAWAQGLDERNLAILLWQVGQYGVRVNSSSGPAGAEYPPPTFDVDSYITKPMRAALRLMAKFEDGGRMTAAEASRQIVEAED